MSDALYDMYVDVKRKVKAVAKCDKDHNKNPEYIEWLNAISIIEASNPDMKQRYERNLAIQETFTYEQKDFICYLKRLTDLNTRLLLITGAGVSIMMELGKLVPEGHAKEMIYWFVESVENAVYLEKPLPPMPER